MKTLLLLLFFMKTLSYPIINCPIKMHESGLLNDLAYLADTVSWNSNYENIQGVCGNYNFIHQSNGIYDTRMRIYSKNNDSIFIVFRPTQMTDEGGNIHVDRQLALCNFINNCQGKVHNRFQQAFLSLINDGLDYNFYYSLKNYKIYITGHSLGGALQLFMGIYLYYTFNIIPSFMLGLAGPFIGDELFSNIYQISLKNILKDNWWQVETINIYDNSEFDGTVEGYNVDYYPYIFIYSKAICGIIVEKLSDSYGMHDLRNYKLFFVGNKC